MIKPLMFVYGQNSLMAFDRSNFNVQTGSYQWFQIPPKQDVLSKPVSVSIKPSESPPPSLSTPSSPGILKYSASPTHRSLSGKLSPSLAKPSLKGHHSPKHSPAHIPSSPKHNLGMSSPKSHGKLFNNSYCYFKFHIIHFCVTHLWK